MRLIVVILACGLAFPALALEGPARVVDGDTLVIAGERVRLRNYNAPELHQPGGIEARARLEALTLGRVVVCAGRARDQYARLVALCSVGGADLGRALRAKEATEPQGERE